MTQTEVVWRKGTLMGVCLGADLLLSELGGTTSFCLILHKAIAETPGMRRQSPENTGLAGSTVETVLE